MHGTHPHDLSERPSIGYEPKQGSAGLTDHSAFFIGDQLDDDVPMEEAEYHEHQVQQLTLGPVATPPPGLNLPSLDAVPPGYNLHLVDQRVAVASQHRDQAHAELMASRTLTLEPNMDAQRIQQWAQDFEQKCESSCNHHYNAQTQRLEGEAMEQVQQFHNELRTSEQHLATWRTEAEHQFTQRANHLQTQAQAAAAENAQ